MQQLAATLNQAIARAERGLNVARESGDQEQQALHEARLRYLTGMAEEYGIPVGIPLRRADGRSAVRN